MGLPTSTAAAAPSALPGLTAPALPTALATPTAARTILYSSDFGGWPGGAVGGQYPYRASRDPATGEYRLALTGPQRGYTVFRTLPDERAFDNVQIDIDARMIAGPDNGIYGLVFRVQPAVAGAETYERYNFVIRADGSYSMSLVGTDGRGATVAPRRTSPAIRPGDAANHLTVVCRGSEITLAVNGQILGTFTGSLIVPGTVGLYVGELSTSSTAPLMEVAFSNLVISSVP